MWLIDKSYYDYDFEPIEDKPQETKPKTTEEMQNVLSKFGIKMSASKSTQKQTEEEKAEALQKEVMAALEQQH